MFINSVLSSSLLINDLTLICGKITAIFSFKKINAGGIRDGTTMLIKMFRFKAVSLVVSLDKCHLHSILSFKIITKSML